MKVTLKNRQRYKKRTGRLKVKDRQWSGDLLTEDRQAIEGLERNLVMHKRFKKHQKITQESGTQETDNLAVTQWKENSLHRHMRRCS